MRMQEAQQQVLHGGWRVPDGVFRALSVLIVIATWSLVVLAYPLLPSTIPSHFSFNGVVDATTVKSWWSVFMPAILQIVLTALLWWLSYHPEYSNIPTSLTLRAIPEPLQTTIKRILSHLMVMVGVLTNLIFAYVSLAIVRVGLGEAKGMGAWTVLGLTAGILALSIAYAVWINRLLQSSTIRDEKNPR